MASSSATVLLAQLVSQWIVSETPQGTPACASDTIVNKDLNPAAASYSPSTTVPVSKYSGVEYTLAGSATGEATIDLTALAGSQGDIDGTGLRVQGLRIQIPSTNAGGVTIGPGDTDAYEPFGTGNSLELPIGARADFWFADQLWDVMGTSGTDPKNIKLSGEVDDTVYVEILMG